MKGWCYILLFLFTSCASLPEATVNYSNFNRIKSGPGSEDILVDSITTSPRLLISCDERREGIMQGSIWAYDFESKHSKELKLILPTSDYSFHPHGFSILSKEGSAFLFVINHKSKKENEILRFKLHKDSLVYQKSFKEGLIGYPNDLYALDLEEFYYSDYKNFGGGLVHVSGSDYVKVVKHMSLPNGVYVIRKENHLPVVFVSTTLSHKVFRCEERNDKWKKDKITRVKGADNFELYNDSLLVASHSRFGKFIKHAKNKEKYSPSVIYLVDPETGGKRVIYSGDGSKISATATGVIYKSNLYLGQVFEPFVLECEITSGIR